MLFGEPIDRFDGTEFAFLSNFCRQPKVMLYVVDYKMYFVNTVEHAYQADKAIHGDDAVKILTASTPAKAKKYGRLVACRDDWDTIKIARMEHWLDVKFADAQLAQNLLATENRMLIEGNDWGDRFWGQVDGVGENWLGRLLMYKRDKLRQNL
jgi:ribA/ribD-fused uncharacterized protein